MRIVFMGTPDFAVPSLRALLEAGYDVAGVVCQPDRPKGRGHKLAACAVKEAALAAGIPVFQPERIKRPEGVQMLRDLAPDLCVTAAFGQILSQELLDIPPMGTVNVHASLLPRHRGSAPVHWSILCGDTQTGVTTMLTDRGMDTGDILLSSSTPIGPRETAGELTERLSQMGARLLIDTLHAMEAGTLSRTPQDAARATYEPMLTKELGRVDFSQTAAQIDRLVRGATPWPGAYCEGENGAIKIFSVRPASERPSAPAGDIVAADGKRGLIVSCGDCDLALEEIQMPGAKRMRAADYLRGHHMTTGASLGKA